MITKKDPKLSYSLHLADELIDKPDPVDNTRVFTINRSKGAYAYSFDSDTKTACADNCANYHIWNDIEDFEDYRELEPK